MAKKRRFKGKKVMVFVFLVVVAVLLILFFKKDKKVPTNEVMVVDTIDSFSYTLNDNETKYYNELFSSLKELLSDESYDEEEYASLVGKLFLADFYDLDSKVMKSDVGGTQFVYEPYRNDFELGAMDTVYKSVESNVYGDRKQSLPVVKSVDMTSISSDSYEYDDDIDYDAYFLDFNIIYDKDLDYPSNVSLVMVHYNDKLEIVLMK